jgi:2-succinyl-6-hydroxy-2,4-cyclohexadiene-1-carboxylate synthase
MTVPALVFIHGFLGFSNDWKKCADIFQSLEKCVFLELGERDQWSRQVAGIGRFVVVGYSMGGRLGLHFAVDAGDACAGAVIVSASPGVEDEAARAARRAHDEMWARRFETEPIKEVLADWYGQPVFASLASKPGLKRELIERRAKNDPRDVARALRGMGAGVIPSLWHRLADVKFPILFVAGGLDPKYVEIARCAAGLCPQGRAAIVPGAGHALCEEAPEELAKIVRAFLDSSTRTTTRTI